MADETPNIDQQFIDRASEIKSIFGDIVSSTASLNRALRAAGESTTNIGSTYRALIASASKVSELQEKAKKSSEGTQKILEEKRKIQSKERELTAEINRLTAIAVTQTGETRNNTLKLAENLSNARDEAGQLEKLYQEMADQAARLDKSTQFFSVASTFIGSIPGLRAFAGPFKEAEEAARRTVAAGKSSAEGFAAGGKALAAGFKEMLGPAAVIAGLVKVFQELVQLGFQVSKQTTEIGKSMGLSREQSLLLRDNFKGISASSENILVNTNSLVEAQSQLQDSLGASARFTGSQLEDQIMLTKQVGLQAESAQAIQEFGLANGRTAEDNLRAVITQTASLAKQTGIQLDNRKVINDIAKVEGQLRLIYQNNPGLIAKAVVQAKQLGLTVEQTRKAAQGLLDFEQSIGNELEAELLTGKDLNLERARALALQGKTVEATAEIARQVGSAAEFGRMNVVQQEAFANAVGLSADELANSLIQRENLAKLGTQTRQEIEREAEALRKRGEVEKANQLLASVGNEEEALAALKRIDDQAKFNATVEKLKSLFADLAEPISRITGPLVGAVELMVKAFPLIAGAVGAIAAGLAASAIRAGILAVQTAIAAGSAITLASVTTLGVGLISIVAGIATGMAALNQAQEGAAQTAEQAAPKVALAAGGIVTKPTTALVGEAGPEAVVPLNKSLNTTSKGVEDRLDALIAAVSKGGNVYMDTNKVGQVNNMLGSYSYTMGSAQLG
jgi:hypothetical protein